MLITARQKNLCIGQPNLLTTPDMYSSRLYLTFGNFIVPLVFITVFSSCNNIKKGTFKETINGKTQIVKRTGKYEIHAETYEGPLLSPASLGYDQCATTIYLKLKWISNSKYQLIYDKEDSKCLSSKNEGNPWVLNLDSSSCRNFAEITIDSILANGYYFTRTYKDGTTVKGVAEEI